MKKSFKIKNIGVDAGMILVADKDFYDKLPYKTDFSDDSHQTIDMPIGEHHIEWEIKNTWNGDISGVETLEVSSGKVIVSDPCYLFPDQDECSSFLDEYVWKKDSSHPSNPEDNDIPGVITLSKMGGDGSYDLKMKIKD